MKRPTELIEMLDTFPEIKLNDDDAEKIYDWINYIESRIQPVSVNKALTGDNATTQPRKTVSDAVDYYNGFWQVDDLKVLSWCDGEDRWSWGNPVGGEYKVCTREEFEKEVERRKGEEWTHVDVDGLKLKLLVDKPDYAGEIPAICEDGYYRMYDFEYLMPIKPSISKAEADAVRAWYAWVKDNGKIGLTNDLIEEYISEHEVK